MCDINFHSSISGCVTSTFKMKLLLLTIFLSVYTIDALVVYHHGPYYRHYRTCYDIKRSSRYAKSGIYNIRLPSGRYKVYCDMDINGGGYTFIAKNNLRHLRRSDLRYLFRKRRSVLLRLKKTNNLQPYTLLRALRGKPDFKVFLNSYTGYTRPQNSNIRPYLYLGILPTRVSRRKSWQGFRSNKRNMWYHNCDGNPNNYFAFFANTARRRPSTYHSSNLIYERKGLAVDWRKTGLYKKTGCNMPSKFFYLTEMHFGGCGAYTSSDRWDGYAGTAIGLR